MPPTFTIRQRILERKKEGDRVKFYACPPKHLIRKPSKKKDECRFIEYLIGIYTPDFQSEGFSKLMPPYRKIL